MSEEFITRNEHEEFMKRMEERDGNMWRQTMGYIVTAVIGILLALYLNK